MADQHDSIIDLLRGAYGDRAAGGVPSKVAEELGLRYAGHEEKKAVSALLPASERFADSMGMYQSGMTAAAMDVVIVALATLLAGRPCTMVTGEVTHLRPLAADGRAYKVEARLRALRSSMVFLEARAENSAGKVVAMATATLAVYKSKRKD